MGNLRSTFAAGLFLLASMLVPNIGWTAPLTRAAVAQALQGRQECVRFRWETGDKGEPHAGVDIPATLDGTQIWLQLDTGADHDVVYDKLASTESRTHPGAKAFRPERLRIGDTLINRPYVSLNLDIKDQTTSGTLGLSDLIGRVAVLDYPGETFCIFSEPNAPNLFTDLAVTPATLRNGKLFLPVRDGDFYSDAIVFDTGSSQFP